MVKIVKKKNVQITQRIEHLMLLFFYLFFNEKC